MQQGGKAAYYTFGCKLNFSETSTIARQLTDAGYSRVEWDEQPDVFVVNTCSVTENADKKCRQLIKRAVKKQPNLKVIVVGCYAQLKPEEIAKMDGVSLVLGAGEKFNVVQFLDQSGDQKVFDGHIKEVKEFHPSYSLGDRTRSFFKVQDGCDYFCSFCTIPLARGRSRSHDIAHTIAEAKKLAQEDVREVVLTGVNIGDFGAGSDENFFGLVQELDKIEGIDRFRISSIEPNLLSNEIIDFVATSQRFMPHFHIPLQSGSDQLLESMRRRYDTKLFADRIHRIKSTMPDACIGIDVIVGYPGETEVLFLETMNFLKEMNPAYLHVFSYSERDNTTAPRMDQVVPPQERMRRSKMLQQLSHKLKRAFYETHLGSQRPALMERDDHDGKLHGFTDNYMKVTLDFDPLIVNQLVNIDLQAIDIDGLITGEAIMPTVT